MSSNSTFTQNSMAGPTGFPGLMPPNDMAGPTGFPGLMPPNDMASPTGFPGLMPPNDMASQMTSPMTNPMTSPMTSPMTNPMTNPMNSMTINSGLTMPSQPEMLVSPLATATTPPSKPVTAALPSPVTTASILSQISLMQSALTTLADQIPLLQHGGRKKTKKSKRRMFLKH